MEESFLKLLYVSIQVLDFHASCTRISKHPVSGLW